jgi:hypothetical protein
MQHYFIKLKSNSIHTQNGQAIIVDLYNFKSEGVIYRLCNAESLAPAAMSKQKPDFHVHVNQYFMLRE